MSDSKKQKVNIKENLQKIKNEIRMAEKNAGRPENSVKLVAVSKFHSVEEIEDAINEGQNVFGENRVQEAVEKFTLLMEKGYTPELHIIGNLQRNKVKDAVKIADFIESVDRLSLLEEIEKQCSKIGKNINIFFEIHTGEETKSGFESEENLFEVLKLCQDGKFPHVTPLGFMTMAPFTDDESVIRKSFKILSELRKKTEEKFPVLNLSELSMGMSGDFKIAIEEGSTQVRIGTAIFGERNKDK